MRVTLALPLLLSLLALAAWPAAAATAPSAAAKSTAPKRAPQPKLRACELLSRTEIKSVQGETPREAKTQESSDAGLRSSHCYFALPTSSRSISVSLTIAGDRAALHKMRESWDARFHGRLDAEGAAGGGKGTQDDKKWVRPQPIEGLGQEAFWLANPVGGELYVLKHDRYFRISVGGTDSEEIRLEKSKRLAQNALTRL